MVHDLSPRETEYNEFMLSQFAKLLLVATSLAPIFLTLWFVEFSDSWEPGLALDLTNNWTAGFSYLVLSILLTLICWGVISYAKSEKGLERMPVKITGIKTADKEILGFLLVYLLPLISQSNSAINTPVLVFVSVIFFVVVLNSHAYHFNPLLGLLGYHFYEATIDGDVTFILITDKTISNCSGITEVVQLTEYMIMDRSTKNGT